jgi:hypothetical protein
MGSTQEYASSLSKASVLHFFKPNSRQCLTPRQSIARRYTNDIVVALKGKRNFAMIHDLGGILYNEFGEVLLAMIQERPFVLCNVHSLRLGIAKQTCSRILHDFLHLKTFTVCSMPHSLSVNPKPERINHSAALFEELTAGQRSGVNHILIGDESSFLFEDLRESVWTTTRERR